MKNRTLPEFCIISGFTGIGYSPDNLQNDTALKDSLKGLKAKYLSCIGYYKGNEEISNLVFLDDDTNKKTIVGLAEHFNQESILFVDRHRFAYLVYLDGREVFVGKWKELSFEEAENVDNCTNIGNRVFSTI
jgi:hypothetical protein